MWEGRRHLRPRILGKVGGLGNPLLSLGLETQPVLDFSYTFVILCFHSHKHHPEGKNQSWLWQTGERRIPMSLLDKLNSS